MGFLQCPLPCQAPKEKNEDHHNSDYSLSGQPSLPSVPSLTLSPTPSSTSVCHHCATTFKGHNSYVFALAIAGKHLVSGSHDNEIRVWRQSPTGNLTDQSNVVATANGAVKALVVLGDRLFSAHQDHKIRAWKIEQQHTSQNDAVGGDGRLLRCVATLPTLKDRLLTPFTAKKNYVQVRRHKTCTWVHHVDTVSALALSHDGSRLYSASWDRTVKIWRTSDFRCVESFNAHDDAINAVVVSSDGLVYTGSADKMIKVWRSETGNQKTHHSLVTTLEKHKSAVNDLALTADGAILYSGACDRSIVVWEKEAGGGGGMEVMGALRGHKNAILCLAVVGESVLCSGSADKTVRVWRREVDRSYACLAVLEGHARPVKSLAVAPDGDGGEGCYLVYSGGLDCDIRVWRISGST